MRELTLTNTLLDEVPVSLESFRQRVGVTDTTVWRWRKMRYIKTVNISGRVYIMGADVREFMRRLEAGEFAKKHTVPLKGGCSKSLKNQIFSCSE